MYIVLLKNARAVVAAERTLRERGIRVRVTPVPEHISSECGLCLEIASEDKKTIEEVLPQATIYEI